MSLCNVYSYLFDPEIGKTIKLSDSYQVRIRLEDWDFSQAVTSKSKNKFALRIPQPENDEIELYECTSVTLPSYKPKTDIFQYGNNAKTFIYMDPKSLDDLEIEVVEHYNSDNTLFVENFVNLCLAKLFDEDTFQYKLDDYIPELTVYVFSNVFHTVYLKYIFKELKLTDYSKYDLDYSTTDLAKWTLKFSYRSFYVESGMEEEYKNETLDNESNDETVEETEVEETTTIVVPDNTVTDPLAEEQNQKKDEQPPATQDAITAPQEATEPDNKNAALQNEFNSTGDVVTAPQESVVDNEPQVTNNEIILDEVEIKSTDVDNDQQTTNNNNPMNVLPQQAASDTLDQRLFGHALDEYNEYVAKLKQKDENFDETKDAFIFFDMSSNTKYAVKDGQIVKEYNAYTAVNDPTTGAGEATEGAYIISEEKGSGGKHKSRQNNAINGIKSFELDVDVISQEVASGKYKNVREAIKGHGVSEEKIKAWENSHKDTGGSTMKASQGHWDYLNYSTYSKNQIDEGNGNACRENQGAYGIHSHVNYKENNEKVLEYEKKKAAGTNTAQDDLEIRKYLAKSKATEGCSIMSSQDIAWESEFIKDNGKVIQFNANGTSTYNKNNDTSIAIAQANNNNNKVNV